MSLGIKRNPSETWLDCALRYAKPYGLEQEIRTAYEREIKDGATEDIAAWRACYEWDVCDLKCP